MNNLENWLDNLKEDALKQALRFLLEPNDPKIVMDNAGFIKLQIEEFSRMYPEHKRTPIPKTSHDIARAYYRRKFT